jgi:hypothetical protein
VSDREITGHRDPTYSRWHRVDNLMEGVGLSRREASSLGMIDADGIEFCRWCSDPLALVELVHPNPTRPGVDPMPKEAAVLTRLGELSRVPVYTIAVCKDDRGGVRVLRVRDLYPIRSDVRELKPVEWVEELLDLRRRHVC